jgi:asparagine synthase (glutamine-hydrolysing)
MESAATAVRGESADDGRAGADRGSGIDCVCGIAGFWQAEPRPTDGAVLRRMTRALTHRGPDAEGFYEQPGISLGHRRLSIIDLRTGQQPLCNEDASVWVACNGEIFNYLELRADLEKRGHRFRTQSDTETLVHLYEEKGLECVNELNGQFAFALWDLRRRRLVLARDRVGIRPLFHATLADGTVLFGSEVKALLAHGALAAEIDPVAVGQVASLWAIIPPRTAFKNVEELAPGRMLVLEGSRRSLSQYWRHRFPRQHEYEERSLDYWSERVREALCSAVRLQLRSDVPVGTYLSGGLDSSILTALARDARPDALNTFSVGFADAAFDERAYQQQVARQLRTDHRQIEVDAATIGRDFADVVWYAERPMMRTAPAPLLRLSELVHRTGIKVVLSGEGADEIFGGYQIFLEDKVRRFWARQPDSAWRPALLSRLYGYVQREPRTEAFWRLFFRKDLERTADAYYSHRRRWDNGAPLQRLFAADFRAQMQGAEALEAELEAYLDPGREGWHPLCRAQYLEMALFMSCYLLNCQGDRVMMGNSVEGRVPFLDHRLIELAAEVPPKFKLRGLEEKFILRHAFRDLVPRAVAQRPKQPYRAPISACFPRDGEYLAAQLLSPEALRRTGFVRVSAVEKLLDRRRTNTSVPNERDEMAVATVASLQLLHHHFIAGDAPQRRTENHEKQQSIAR